MFGTFLRHVSREFRAIGSASRLDFLGFFLGELRAFLRMSFLRSAGFFFRVVLLEDRSAGKSVSFRFLRGFFVLGFGEIRGQRGDLIFTEFGVGVGMFRLARGRCGSRC